MSLEGFETAFHGMFSDGIYESIGGVDTDEVLGTGMKAAAEYFLRVSLRAATIVHLETVPFNNDHSRFVASSRRAAHFPFLRPQDDASFNDVASYARYELGAYDFLVNTLEAEGYLPCHPPFCSRLCVVYSVSKQRTKGVLTSRRTPVPRVRFARRDFTGPT